MTIHKYGKEFHVQEEKDGTYTGFIADWWRACWVGADSEENAVEGVYKLYKDLNGD